MIVAFSGHRPHKLGGYDIETNELYPIIHDRIKESLYSLAPTKTISGMALGMDQWAASICVEIKIPFIAAVPFEGQESIWSYKSQKVFNELLKKASEVVIVSEGEYSAHKLQVRNEWMVDRVDVIIKITSFKMNLISYG